MPVNRDFRDLFSAFSAADACRDPTTLKPVDSAPHLEILTVLRALVGDRA